MSCVLLNDLSSVITMLRELVDFDINSRDDDDDGTVVHRLTSHTRWMGLLLLHGADLSIVGRTGRTV